jgi:hypothetical protein
LLVRATNLGIPTATILDVFGGERNRIAALLTKF